MSESTVPRYANVDVNISMRSRLWRHDPSTKRAINQCHGTPVTGRREQPLKNLHMNTTPETLTQGYRIPKKILTPQRYDEPLNAPVLTTGLRALLRHMWTLHVYGILSPDANAMFSQAGIHRCGTLSIPATACDLDLLILADPNCCRTASGPARLAQRTAFVRAVMCRGCVAGAAPLNNQRPHNHDRRGGGLRDK
jgi:hypothetical protein